MFFAERCDWKKQYLENILQGGRFALSEQPIQQTLTAVIDRGRATLEHCRVQSIFVLEAIVQQRLGNTGLLRNQAHARALIAVAREDLLRRIPNSLARGNTRRSFGLA